jgi:hypothetical protein
MEEWEFADLWEWDDEEGYQDHLDEMADELAERFFVSDNDYVPSIPEDYDLGYLSAEEWWPLVVQLDEMVDLENVLALGEILDTLLDLPGVPTEVLEDPCAFLKSVLEGNLPADPSGRRVGSRKLVKIALVVVELIQEFPETAQAAVRAWAGVHRGMMRSLDLDAEGKEDLADLLSSPDLPPAMTGFSMMIALTLMRWPKRAEGLPLPNDFAQPEFFDSVLAQWEALPESPTFAEENVGEAEALFAQGQLAYLLAQMGTMELMSSEGVRDEELSLAYSRLSRAILWIHHQCRHCPERNEVACRVATNWPDRPVPLLDVAGEIANTARIAGCIKMG